MHKWIVGSTCAAALFSVAVASAQTSQSDQTPTTRPSSPTGASSSTQSPTNDQRVTVTGCMMQGTGQPAGWQLSKAIIVTPPSGATASRSGSPSNEGTSAGTAGNRNGTGDSGVSGSTSAPGTSGTTGTTGTAGTTGNAGTATGSTDTEVNGRGTAATDQSGSTVGAGATSGATTPSSPSSAAGTSYQLSGVQDPTQYANKQVEVIGTMSRPSGATGGNRSNQTLTVTAVKILSDNCR